MWKLLKNYKIFTTNPFIYLLDGEHYYNQSGQLIKKSRNPFAKATASINDSVEVLRRVV